MAVLPSSAEGNVYMFDEEEEDNGFFILVLGVVAGILLSLIHI